MVRDVYLGMHVPFEGESVIDYTESKIDKAVFALNNRVNDIGRKQNENNKNIESLFNDRNEIREKLFYLFWKEFEISFWKKIIFIFSKKKKLKDYAKFRNEHKYSDLYHCKS